MLKPTGSMIRASFSVPSRPADSISTVPALNIRPISDWVMAVSWIRSRVIDSVYRERMPRLSRIRLSVSA